MYLFKTGQRRNGSQLTGPMDPTEIFSNPRIYNHLALRSCSSYVARLGLIVSRHLSSHVRIHSVDEAREHVPAFSHIQFRVTPERE